MHDPLFPVPEAVARAAHADNKKYLEMYDRSVKDPEGFWGEHGKRIDWIKPYSKVKDTSFQPPVHVRWYHDGTLNASANCIDRHLKTRGNQTAILWEGDDPGDSKKITYKELHEHV
ncbi:MAG: acetyl-coenzyme A synthetase N-terminal domain-containing protein, partial [Pseudomonadota bacterium]